MAYAPLIMAGVSALSSYMTASRQRKAEAQRAGAMRRLASPEHLKQVIGQLMPFYRELVNAGLGPMFIQESARAISEAGLSGSGVGEALRGLSKAVPTSMATQEATGEAGNVVNRELGAVGASPLYEGNPLGEALAAGARAYFGTAQGQRTQQKASEQSVMSEPAPLAPTAAPVSYPTGPFPGEPPLFPTSSTNPLDRPGVNI